MDVPTPDLVTLTQKIIMHSNINLCRHRVQQNTCTYIFLNSDNIDFAICNDHSFALNAFFYNIPGDSQNSTVINECIEIQSFDWKNLLQSHNAT